jgi:HAD superfamily phosphoserine phosphatase-like hydrolase
MMKASLVGAGPWLSAKTWDPEVRDGLERMIAAGGDGALAALDFDQTCAWGDVSETALAILARRTGRDLVGEYEAECRIDMKKAYIDLVSTLVAGRTEAEARAMALEALAEGEAGGHLAIREPMRELVWALQRHGWEVWVVTASAEALVQAVAERMGIHPHRVVGMRSPLGPDGRYGASVSEPVTYREGKLVALRQATGRDPVFAAGDSRSDAPMMAAARYALLLDRGDEGLRAEAERAGWWIQPGERIR